MWPFTRRDRTEEQRTISSVPWGPSSSWGNSDVDVNRALSLIPVYGCARVLADTISSLPLNLYRQVGDSPQIQLSTPSLLAQPSVHGTLFDWLHRCITSLAIRGNSTGLITARDYLGFPTSVEWLDPNDVFVNDQSPSGPGSYLNPTWYVASRVIDKTDIIHIPWFTVPWRVLGLSPIGLFAASINTGIAAQEYPLDWFSNGGVPPGRFKNNERTVTKEDADIITTRLTARIRSHKPLVYGRDWDYEPISVTPNEAKFIETARLNATQIATIYGVDPTMVGGEVGGSMTYANSEQLGIKQLTYTFGPWIARLEAALSTLFPRGQYVRFDVDSLLRTDVLTRWNVHKIAVDMGAMDINEIRELEDLPLKTIAPPPILPPSEQPSNGQQPTLTAPATPTPPAAANGGSSNGARTPARHHYPLPPPSWAMPD